MIDGIKGKRILVVVAHPDDEVLGLGGTINRLILEYNCKVKAVILGEGITSRSDERDENKWKSQLNIHKANIESARQAIGYESVGIFNFPDNRFDSIDLLDLIKVLEKEKEDFKPEIIFTHHGGDLNIDHQKTFQAVITATRPMSSELVNTIITFETPSGTEWKASSDPAHFIPNLFISISKENLLAKIAAMESYEFERREYPHPRSPQSLEILAKYRGLQVGHDYAEAFTIVRLLS